MDRNTTRRNRQRVGQLLVNARGNVDAGLVGQCQRILQSATTPTTIAVDGSYASSITATTGSADGDLLGSLLASGESYRVTVWARVHEQSPSGDASYLIQLGSNNDVACAFACKAVMSPVTASSAVTSVTNSTPVKHNRYSPIHATALRWNSTSFAYEG